MSCCRCEVGKKKHKCLDCASGNWLSLTNFTGIISHVELKSSNSNRARFGPSGVFFSAGKM